MGHIDDLQALERALRSVDANADVCDEYLLRALGAAHGVGDEVLVGRLREMRDQNSLRRVEARQLIFNVERLLAREAAA